MKSRRNVSEKEECLAIDRKVIRQQIQYFVDETENRRMAVIHQELYHEVSQTKKLFKETRCRYQSARKNK